MTGSVLPAAVGGLHPEITRDAAAAMTAGGDAVMGVQLVRTLEYLWAMASFPAGLKADTIIRRAAVLLNAGAYPEATPEMLRQGIRPPRPRRAVRGGGSGG